jgi:putative ABC transport system permease protein
VIDQLRFFSPRQPDDPTYYIYYRELQTNLVASIRFSGDPKSMLGQVRDGWRRLAPGVPFTGDTADRRLAKFYEDDDRATRLFGMGAGLAVLIGCVGLWGLASFNTARRVKEIGIRKVLGASTGYRASAGGAVPAPCAAGQPAGMAAGLWGDADMAGGVR